VGKIDFGFVWTVSVAERCLRVAKVVCGQEGCILPGLPRFAGSAKRTYYP